jgi:coenzyme F420-reducing hydrogenase delta subunit
METDGKKKMVAFCCENSSFIAAEAAGRQEREILDLVDLVSLPCTGKMEINYVLSALERGHRGVLILGCPLDNCKYLRGNYRANKRVEMVKTLLHQAGMEQERVDMNYLSSVDTQKFINIVREMDKHLDQLTSTEGREGEAL